MFYPEYQQLYAFVATKLLYLRIMEHLSSFMGNSEFVGSYWFNYH